MSNLIITEQSEQSELMCIVLEIIIEINISIKIIGIRTKEMKTLSILYTTKIFYGVVEFLKFQMDEPF